MQSGASYFPYSETGFIISNSKIQKHHKSSPYDSYKIYKVTWSDYGSVCLEDLELFGCF